MARSNTGSNANRATFTGTLTTTTLATVALWFKPANLTANNNLYFQTSAGFDQYYGLIYDGANLNGLGDNVVLAETSQGATGQADAVSPAGGVAGEWMHCAAVFNGPTSRQAFLNGVGGTVNTGNFTPTAASHLHITSLSTFSPMNGSLAEVGVWNVALTADEILALSKGYSPLFIRTNQLMGYFPLWGRGTETNIITRSSLTAVGTLLYDVHPKILMPTSTLVGFPGTIGGGPAVLTLPADPGTYLLSGSAASLEYGREVAAVGGTYALTGTAASVERGYEVLAVGGTYALSGTAASLELTREVVAVGGTYSLSGTAASIERGYEVLAVGGTYSLSGTDASLERGYEVLAVGGIYALTGTPATFSNTYEVQAVGGVYSLSGTAVSLNKGISLIAVGGSYSLSGSPASLELNRIVTAVGGSYTISGTAATLERGLEVIGQGGSYLLSGTAASLEKGYEVIAQGGVYLLIGSDATLTAAGAPTPPGGDAKYWVSTDNFFGT